jgi:uncharacterized coiled-coil protein SlyX
MENDETVKRVAELEERLKLAEEHILSLSRAIAAQHHPSVINSLINQNNGGSILDGLF